MRKTFLFWDMWQEVRRLTFGLIFILGLFICPVVGNGYCRKMKKMRFNIRTLIMTVSVLIWVAVFPLSAFGECPASHYEWIGGSGDWSTPEKWSHQEWDPCTAQCIPLPGVPSLGDKVVIRNGGNVTVTQAAGAGTMDIESSLITIQGVALNATGYAVADLGGQIVLNDGFLSAGGSCIGLHGVGEITQSGGMAFFEGDWGLSVGQWSGSEGTYSLSGGSLSAKSLTVGYEGIGTFIQTGGTATIGEDGLKLGSETNSEGNYELLGGTLIVEGGMTVGEMGTGSFVLTRSTLNVAGNANVGKILCGGSGSFVVDNGTINGTSEKAYLWVWGGKGSLTGPGTFNINVEYSSEAIYGTNKNGNVAVDFNPNCLTAGGAFSVTQITPADFAGGNVPNLLPSSVFDISFDGSFCGDFAIGIPYDEAEVAELGANENDLVILHETGPGTYEVLYSRYLDCNYPVDTKYDIAKGHARSFGKFAVVKGKEFMITFDDGPVRGNTENIVNALKNIYVGSEPVRAAFFMVGVGCCEDSNCFCPWWECWQNKGSVRANPGLVQMVDDADHFIGIHTQHHPCFGGLFWFQDWSVDKIKLEISADINEIKNASVDSNLIFRPPYFCNTPNVRKAVKAFDGLQMILGAGENRDKATDIGWRFWIPWCYWPSVEEVEKKAKELIESWKRDEPCILVFHDISPITANNIAEIIRYLREDEGFTLVHFDPSRLSGSPPSLIQHTTDTIHQSETLTHTVSLDSTVNTATFNVSWEGSDLDLVLYKPDGTRMDSNSALADPNIKYAERDTYEYYTVSDPNPGSWIMEVSGVTVPSEGEKYTIRVEADTNLALFAFTDKPDYDLNEHINIAAELANDENSVTGASVMAKVQRPDGSVDNLTLYDDGTHGDKDTNDGFYANDYNNTSLRGSYEITVSAIGELTGDQYERASSLTVMVGSIIYGNVDFGAYAVFANRWMDQNCAEPDWCDTADLDQSEEVDIFDLYILADHWLEGTSP